MACQEGYYAMLLFMGDKHNHSEFDDAVLDFTAKNMRDRTPLFLCFTPPTATVILKVWSYSADMYVYMYNGRIMLRYLTTVHFKNISLLFTGKLIIRCFICIVLRSKFRFG